MDDKGKSEVSKYSKEVVPSGQKGEACYHPLLDAGLLFQQLYLTQLLFLDYWNLGMARVDGAISAKNMKIIYQGEVTKAVGRCQCHLAVRLSAAQSRSSRSELYKHKW